MATMAQAKDYYQRGLLGPYQIQRVGNEYLVRFQFKTGSVDFPLVDARGKLPRRFKTADAAIRAIEEVGFAGQICLLSSSDWQFKERELF